jgi:hypothetical protein
MQWPRLEGRTLQRLIPRYAPTARARIARRYHGGAQRCGRPGPQHIQGGIISFRRRKTTIPVHCPMLLNSPAAIEAMPKAKRLAFSLPSAASRSQWLALAIGSEIGCDAAGIADFSAHGLRKADAIRVLLRVEQPITKSCGGVAENLGEVQRYTSTGHRRHDAGRQGDVSNDGRVCRVRAQHDRGACARWGCPSQGEWHQERGKAFGRPRVPALTERRIGEALARRGGSASSFGATAREGAALSSQLSTRECWPLTSFPGSHRIPDILKLIAFKYQSKNEQHEQQAAYFRGGENRRVRG